MTWPLMLTEPDRLALVPTNVARHVWRLHAQIHTTWDPRPSNQQTTFLFLTAQFSRQYSRSNTYTAFIPLTNDKSFQMPIMNDTRSRWQFTCDPINISLNISIELKSIAVAIFQNGLQLHICVSSGQSHCKDASLRRYQSISLESSCSSRSPHDLPSEVCRVSSPQGNGV